MSPRRSTARSYHLLLEGGDRDLFAPPSLFSVVIFIYAAGSKKWLCGEGDMGIMGQKLRISMQRTCQVTGRKPSSGRIYALRGIAKKKKGIGLKITGITNRRFLPNLQKKRWE